MSGFDRRMLFSVLPGLMATVLGIAPIQNCRADGSWFEIYSSSPGDPPSAPSLAVSNDGTLVAAFSERRNFKTSVRVSLLDMSGNLRVSTIADQWNRATQPGIAYIPGSKGSGPGEESLSVQFGAERNGNDSADPLSTGRLVSANSPISSLNWTFTPNASPNKLAVNADKVSSVLLTSGALATIFAPGTSTAVGDEITAQFGDSTSGTSINLNPDGRPVKSSIAQDQVTGEVIGAFNNLSNDPVPAGTYYLPLFPNLARPALIPESGNTSTSFLVNSNTSRATRLATPQSGGVFSLFCQVGSFPCKILRLDRYSVGTVSPRITATRGLEISEFTIPTFANDKLWPTWLESRAGVAGYQVMSIVTDTSLKSKSIALKISIPKGGSLDRVFGFDTISLGRNLWVVVLIGDSSVGYRYLARRILEPVSLVCKGIAHIQKGGSSSISCVAKDVDGNALVGGTLSVRTSRVAKKTTDTKGRAAVLATFNKAGKYSVMFSKDGYERTSLPFAVGGRS